MISTNKIKEMIELISGTDITEIEVSDSKGVQNIRISRNSKVSGLQPGFQSDGYLSHNIQVTDSKAENQAREKISENTQDQAQASDAIEVIAPLVGTYYSSPKPDEPSFVQVGDIIHTGQTICVIEAMKIFNEIESDHSGKVIKLLLDNEQPVEYGQTIMILEPI